MRFQNFVLNEKKYHSGMDFSDVQGSIKGKTLIFFDTETTGLDPNIKYVQITEIAGVAYDDKGNQLDTFHQKIHLTDNVKKVIAWEKKNGKAFAGGRKTVEELLDMTGYYDENTEFGEEIEVLTEFKQWVESFPNPVLIAQNLEFDMKQVGTKVGAPSVVNTYDTLLFARIFMEAIMDSLRGNEDIEKAREIMSVIKKNRWGKEYKKLSHTLDKLGQVFNVKTDMWHSAIADTQQLAGIFFSMLEWYNNHKEEIDPEKYGKQLRKKIQKDVGFSKWQKKMQKGDPKKRKDANKAFAQEFGEQTNRDNTHSRDGVNAKLRQHDLKPEQDLNAISHMSRDFGSTDGAWEDVKNESEHEEEELEGLEELFKPYPWSGGRDDEDDMFADYRFETDDGIKYSAWVDKTRSPDDAPAYEIGFGVETGGPAADTQVTLNSTDATDVVATVLDIVNNEVDASEFWMVFEPTKDNKGQDASKSKRASLYSRMITRSAKSLGQEILDVKNQGDYVLVKVRKGHEEDLVEMPLRMDQESRPLVAEWAPSKWMREVRWSVDLGTYQGTKVESRKYRFSRFIESGPVPKVKEDIEEAVMNFGISRKALDDETDGVLRSMIKGAIRRADEVDDIRFSEQGDEFAQEALKKRDAEGYLLGKGAAYAADFDTDIKDGVMREAKKILYQVEDILDQAASDENVSMLSNLEKSDEKEIFAGVKESFDSGEMDWVVFYMAVLKLKREQKQVLPRGFNPDELD